MILRETPDQDDFYWNDWISLVKFCRAMANVTILEGSIINHGAS